MINRLKNIRKRAICILQEKSTHRISNTLTNSRERKEGVDGSIKVRERKQGGERDGQGGGGREENG